MSNNPERKIQRAKAKTPEAMLKKQIKAMSNDLGQAKMAVLNMRQMYRQAEQDILVLRQQLNQRETLIAAIMIATNKQSILIEPPVLEEVNEDFAGLDIENVDGNVLVALQPILDMGDEDEEAPFAEATE